MPRWLWFLPVALVVLLGALMAFRLGWIAANLTESEAIAAYAARFAAQEGAGVENWDCLGRPGEAVWLVIRCGTAARYWEYQVNRFGGLVGIIGPSQGQNGGRPRT
ncbi:hypothetical protein [Tropicibacter oceani]|uniref:Uncharacterized protein n=1 Tax=Tropicibacter oceani TaxID=3058420 RepID=A0ABY8QD46_9RHOB|nr:hypothetical protein [Tropicibacter oceani]WGW02546.1 hypothetical protein QF118_11375 [Tropicibacter oceani]